jgi:hypothetical protein
VGLQTPHRLDAFIGLLDDMGLVKHHCRVAKVLPAAKAPVAISFRNPVGRCCRGAPIFSPMAAPRKTSAALVEALVKISSASRHPEKKDESIELLTRRPQLTMRRTWPETCKISMSKCS